MARDPDDRPILATALALHCPRARCATSQDRGVDEALGRFPGAVRGGRPQVRGGVQGGRRLGASEGSLDGDDVAALGDQAAGEEVPRVVELYARQARVAQRFAPPVADGVLVRRIAGRSGKEPAIWSYGGYAATWADSTVTRSR